MNSAVSTSVMDTKVDKTAGEKLGRMRDTMKEWGVNGMFHTKERKLNGMLYMYCNTCQFSLMYT